MQLPWPTLDACEAVAEFAALPVGTQQPFADLFTTRETIGTQTSQRAIAACLFFGPFRAGKPWPAASPETIETTMVRGGTMTWAAAYLDPLRNNLRRLAQDFPGWDCHLFLAGDLAFLADQLTFPGVIIHSMASSFPAAVCWRWLADDLPGVAEVLAVDCENDWAALPLRRALVNWRRSDLALLRFVGDPGDFAGPPFDETGYVPIIGSHVGWRPQADFPMRSALAAFARLASLGRVPSTHRHGHYAIRSRNHAWPWYGADEVFAMRVWFPWMLSRGVLTLVGDAGGSPYFFQQDVAACRAAHLGSVVQVAA